VLYSNTLPKAGNKQLYRHKYFNKTDLKYQVVTIECSPYKFIKISTCVQTLDLFKVEVPRISFGTQGYSARRGGRLVF
jgi:hypothetical protein